MWFSKNNRSVTTTPLSLQAVILLTTLTVLLSSMVSADSHCNRGKPENGTVSTCQPQNGSKTFKPSLFVTQCRYDQCGESKPVDISVRETEIGADAGTMGCELLSLGTSTYQKASDYTPKIEYSAYDKDAHLSMRMLRDKEYYLYIKTACWSPQQAFSRLTLPQGFIDSAQEKFSEMIISPKPFETPWDQALLDNSDKKYIVTNFMYLKLFSGDKAETDTRIDLKNITLHLDLIRGNDTDCIVCEDFWRKTFNLHVTWHYPLPAKSDTTADVPTTSVLTGTMAVAGTSDSVTFSATAPTPEGNSSIHLRTTSSSNSLIPSLVAMTLSVIAGVLKQ